jgi:hypothetical protein
MRARAANSTAAVSMSETPAWSCIGRRERGPMRAACLPVALWVGETPEHGTCTIPVHTRPPPGRPGNAQSSHQERKGPSLTLWVAHTDSRTQHIERRNRLLQPSARGKLNGLRSEASVRAPLTQPPLFGWLTLTPTHGTYARVSRVGGWVERWVTGWGDGWVGRSTDGLMDDLSASPSALRVADTDLHARHIQWHIHPYCTRLPGQRSLVIQK